MNNSNNFKNFQGHIDYEKAMEQAKEEYRNSPDNSREQLAAMRKINDLQRVPHCKNN